MASIGEDFFFVSTPQDSLKCCICLDVARDPKQEEGCGKLFCGDCVDAWGEDVCPMCKTNTPKYFKDKRSHREIQALSVRCRNVQEGCGWEGTFEMLRDHINNNCDYKFVTCPNGCTVEIEDQYGGYLEDLEILRKDLDEHLCSCPGREYQCQDCGLEDQYQVIVGPHEEECEKKVISCPNNDCKISLERWKVQDHIREDCEFAEVNCKYINIGCEVKMIRRDIVQHEEDIVHHFPIAVKKISELNEIVAQRNKMPPEEKKTQVIFKLVNFYEKKKNNLRQEFKPFFSSPSGFKMSFYVYCDGIKSANGNFVSVFIAILRGPYDEHLELPFRGTIIIELLNQIEDEDHYEQRLCYDEDIPHARPGGGGWGKSHFISHKALMLEPHKYLEKESMFFRVTVEQTHHKHWLTPLHTN